VPGQPLAPTLKISSKTSLEIMWDDPIDLGGTTLDAYVVEMDSGSSGMPGIFRIM